MTIQTSRSGNILLRDISTLATLNSKLGDIRDAAVYIEGPMVRWVGPTAAIPPAYLGADQVISLRGHVMLPGLVNTHHHMFQSLTRCIAQDAALFGWLTTLYQAWRHLRGEDVYNGCRLSIAELLLSGCTTTSDHHYIFPNDVTLDDTIRAARDMGIRFHPTRGVMSKGESKGGLPPDCVCEEEDVALMDAERLIQEYHDPTPYSMLRLGIAPCAPFNVTHDLMIRAAAMARRYPKVRLHTHLAENQEDLDFMEDHYGCTNMQYIKEVGWDRDDVWFAHCVMLSDEEMKLFATEGIGIAHCPSSNLRLASGICPVRKLRDIGVNVGLGVDGSASNDCAHVLGEARLAMLLQRHKGNSAGMTVREALEIAIKGGARNLGRDDIGEVAPGFAADLVAWKVDDKVAFCGAQHDPVSGLLLCSPGHVSLSIINGRVIIQNGAFLHVDLKEVMRAHHWSSARITAHIHPMAKEHWDNLCSGSPVQVWDLEDKGPQQEPEEEVEGARGRSIAGLPDVEPCRGPTAPSPLDHIVKNFFPSHDVDPSHKCFLCHHGLQVAPPEEEEGVHKAEGGLKIPGEFEKGKDLVRTSSLCSDDVQVGRGAVPRTPQKLMPPLAATIEALRAASSDGDALCPHHQVPHSFCTHHGPHCTHCIQDHLKTVWGWSDCEAGAGHNSAAVLRGQVGDVVPASLDK